jgi:DNA-binding response OmpR family regulator
MINVLFVEDHIGTARLIQLILKREYQAYNFYHVDYMRDALEVLEAEAIDIILLDLNLPDSQGIETIHTIHSYASYLPIILMTGLGDEEINREASKHGACDIYIKGNFDAKDLSKRILELVKC